MDVVSTCPLPVASFLWQPAPSAWMLTVVCRATFLMLPTESALAPNQDPPIEEDEYWIDDGARSLRAASDLAPLKPRADVTLVGHAFAPQGAAVRSLTARILVGEIDKVIDVQGDRAFDQAGALDAPKPFSRMPLRYERAAGGPETSNPIGVPGSPDVHGRIRLPNLVPHGIAITSPSDHIAPVGFGPIAPGWPTRHDKLGRNAARMRPPYGQQQPLPEDLDPSYFNHAPRDQQVAQLRENERIILENLHADHPRLVTNLPGVRPRATVERRGGTQPVPLRCDTLWIDTDRALCTLTWRGQVLLDSRKEAGRVVFSLDAQARPAAAAPPPPPALAYVGPAVPEPPLLGPIPVSAPRPGPAPAPVPPPVPPRMSAIAEADLQALDDAADTLVPAVRRPVSPSPTDTLVPAVRAQAKSAASALPFSPAQPQAPKSERAGTPASGLPFVARTPVPPPPPPTSRPSVRTAPPLPPPLPSPSRPPARVEGRTAIHLLWFDVESLPRIRRKPMCDLVISAVDRPVDPEIDDPAGGKDPAWIEDRRDVFEVLARGEVIADEATLVDAVEQAVRDDGKFVPPLVILEGDVRPSFDELAALRATISTAARFAAGDERLETAIAEAGEVIRTPNPLFAPGMLEDLTALVQEAFREGRRAAPRVGYLEDQIERALLARRCYQRREVFGGTHVRALLEIAGATRAVPVYLPEAAATRLPMFSRFRARMVCEAYLQEDQFEAQPIALRAAAIARLAPMELRGPRSR